MYFYAYFNKNEIAEYRERCREIYRFQTSPSYFPRIYTLKKLDHLIHKREISYRGKQIPYYPTHDNKALNKEFFNYLNYGGYPEVVLSEKLQHDMGRFVKSDIVDKVLLRDLPSLYGVRDIQELNSFFSYLAYNNGQEFSLDRMCKDNGIKKEIIKKYLEYLEAAFLINLPDQFFATYRLVFAGAGNRQ